MGRPSFTKLRFIYGVINFYSFVGLEPKGQPVLYLTYEVPRKEDLYARC